jgi:hypothetical protein
MPDRLNHRLFFGPYRCPRVRVGQKLDCEYRGRAVMIRGFSDARIMWPYTRGGGTPSLIVFGPLIKAIERESVSAVAHHWGVSKVLVSLWRRSVGVPRDTPGTKRLDARRIAKLTELSQSAEMRRYKSACLKRQYRRGERRNKYERQWTRQELALLGTDSDASIARALGCPISTVHSKRRRLKIPAHGTRGRRFSAREIALLGTDSDAIIARRLRRHASLITRKRVELGIPSAQERAGRAPKPWTRREIAQLGRAGDRAVAAKLGRSFRSVYGKRAQLGIPPFQPMRPLRRFTPDEIALLGTDTDRAIADILDRDPRNVRRKREQLGIRAFRR